LAKTRSSLSDLITFWIPLSPPLILTGMVCLPPPPPRALGLERGSPEIHFFFLVATAGQASVSALSGYDLLLHPVDKKSFPPLADRDAIDDPEFLSFPTQVMTRPYSLMSFLDRLCLSLSICPQIFFSRLILLQKSATFVRNTAFFFPSEPARFVGSLFHPSLRFRESD